MVTSAADPELPELPLNSDDPIESVVSAELGRSDVVVMNIGLSVNVGVTVKVPFKLSSKSLNESLLVVSGAVSKGVDWEAGDCVVIVMLLYCRFRCRGK